MSTESKTRTVIVAAVDGTEAADDVIRYAVAAARGFRGGEIHYVHIAEPPMRAEMPIDREALLVEGRKVLREVMRKTEESFVGRVEGHTNVALAAQGILQLASDLRADLVIVGTHGRGPISRFFLGSVSHTVLERARCAVVVARPADYTAPQSSDIAPACPECVAVQESSNGLRLWCESHGPRTCEPHVHCRSVEVPAVAAAE